MNKNKVHYSRRDINHDTFFYSFGYGVCGFSGSTNENNFTNDCEKATCKNCLKVLEAIDKRDKKLKVHYGNDQYNYPRCGNFGQRRTNNVEEVTCESCLRLMGKKNNDFPKRSQSFSAYRSKNLVCLTIKFKPMLPEEAAVLTDDIMERYSKHLKDGKMKEEENETHDSRE